MKRPSCRKCLLLRFTVLILWAAAVLGLSLTPDPYRPSSALLGWDKAQHLFAYGLMTLLAGRTFSLFTPSAQRGWLWGGGFAFGFGALVEVAQGLMGKGRMADAGDLLANGIGAGICLAGVWFFTVLKKRAEP